MRPPYTFCSFISLLLAAGSGGLCAQAIVPAQTELKLTAPVGGTSGPVQVAVNSSGSPLVLNMTVTTYGTGNWLTVSPAVGVPTPTTLVIVADARDLAVGTYGGAVIISAPGATNSPYSLPVSFTVGSTTPAAVTVSPPSLTFTAQTASLVPSPQTLGISSSPAGMSFAISASTQSGGSWLVLSTPSGTAPAPVTVSVLTAGLLPGSYAGTILITPAAGPTVTVPVTLNITSGNVIQVSATGLQYYYQIGGFLPTFQTFDVSSTAGVQLGFAVTPTTADGGHWLAATPVFANTPQTVTVSVSPVGFAPGIYTGKVNVSTPAAANSSVDVPVTLTISNGALLTVSGTPQRFVYQTGGALPPAQSVMISSTTSTQPLSYTAVVNTSSGGAWLSVAPATGQTPQTLTIVANPSSLASGTYSGTISISSQQASNSPVTIPVTLSVGDNSTLTSTVSSVALNYQVGGMNQILSQLLTINSTGQPVQVSATTYTNTCGANWLRAYPAQFTTPSAVTIGVEPLGFTVPADCTGYVTFTPASGGQSLQIPVSLKVATTRLMNVTPLSLEMSAPFEGETTAEQTIRLSVTDNSAVNFTVQPSAAIGASWLKVSAATGTTPATIKVTADPNNLSVGTYSGAILIGSSALANTVSIPVTFRVTSTIAAAVSPVSLNFTQVVGSAPPASQSISLTSTGGSTPFVATPSTSNSMGWLSVSPISGATPNTVSVGVNGAGLPPGSYPGSVVFTMPAAANSPITVPVQLRVVAARTITAAPSAISFTYRAGGAAPASQELRVTSTGDPLPVNAAAATLNGGPWLSLSPASGTTPVSFAVAINPAGLATGNYTGNITLTSTGAAGSPITIPVQLDVISAPQPALNELYNAASGQRGAIAPGEIITIKGASLGPAEGLTLQLTPAGTVATVLGGARVFFDEFESPMLYASAVQINAVVPYEVAGRSTVRVVIDSNGVRSQAMTYQVAATAPGIFTTTQTGRGQGAILNQDNSYNSASTPAAPGSIIQIYATGEGVTRPAQRTGGVTRGFYGPQAPVIAVVGGYNAEVLFAGSAPESVAGLFQVNVRIPNQVPAGDIPITILVGGNPSPSGVTVAVR